MKSAELRARNAARKMMHWSVLEIGLLFEEKVEHHHGVISQLAFVFRCFGIASREL
jgi:hypothetical protein